MGSTGRETNIASGSTKKATIMLGLTITLAIGVFLYYIGLFTSFYGLGFIFTGTILLVIPRSFGCRNFKILVLFGIIFFLVTTAIGAFAVSKPMLETNDDLPHDLSFITQKEHDGIVSISVNYNNVANTKDIYIKFEKITWVCYNHYHALADSSCQYKLGLSQDLWKASNIKISTDDVYFYTFFTMDELNEKIPIESGFYSFHEHNITLLALETNAYYVGISAIIFLFILFFVREFRKNLDNIRSTMEAEGRLYPKGHGLCKQCGSIVLPGEIFCKKCGSHVDVPDQFQAKKTEFFQCSECNAEVPMNATVCPECGTKFDESDEIIFVNESIGKSNQR